MAGRREWLCISLSCPLNLHHPNTPPRLFCSIPSPYTSPDMAGVDHMYLRGGGGWSQGLGGWFGGFGGFFFLKGLGREVAKTVVVCHCLALKASPKKRGLGRGFFFGGGGRCVRWGLGRGHRTQPFCWQHWAAQTGRAGGGGGADHHPCSQPLPSRRGAQEVCKDVYMLDWPC